MTIRTSPGEAILCSDLQHSYSADGTAPVLIDIEFAVEAGESVAILGSSGSGKSTLLTLLAGLQRPTSGTILIGDTDLTALTEPELLQVRATRLAVVAQNPYRNLLPYGTALDNLLFAQRAPRSHGRHDLPDPRQLLADLGLSLVADSRCDRLSGGERQRLALGAALCTAPAVILTDEPTSQLDRVNSAAIADLLQGFARDRHVTVVAVTHDALLAERLDRTIRIHDGRLEQ